MRTAFNFVITGVILYLASVLFPDAVVINGFWSLVLATVLIFGIASVMMLASALLLTFFVMNYARNLVLIVLGVLILLSSVVVAVAATNALMSGFTVEGLWPQLLLALVLMIPQIQIDKEDGIF